MKTNRIKRILFPIFALFLAFRSIDLVQQVLSKGIEAYTPTQTFAVAALLVLFVTGVFAFPGFAFPTNRLLPRPYYTIKNPTRLKQVYHWLGIRYFRVFLLAFFWGSKKNRRKYFDGTRKGLQNFIYQAKQSEFGHLFAFVSLVLIAFLMLAYGHLYLFILLILLNVVCNFYPVLLQRYHRIRINKILHS